MDNEDIITTDELSGDENNNVGSSDSQVTDSHMTDSSNLSLEELNAYLGKNYPTKESALKSLKDTFSYVGKKKDDVVKEVVNTDGFVSKEQYERDMFYSKNQEYDTPAIREIIESMAKSKGLTPRDIVSTDSFKEVFGAFKSHKETQQLKTVLESNPRLASTKSNLSEAQKAMQSGDVDNARTLATKAVMDAFEM